MDASSEAHQKFREARAQFRVVNVVGEQKHRSGIGSDFEFRERGKILFLGEPAVIVAAKFENVFLAREDIFQKKPRILFLILPRERKCSLGGHEILGVYLSEIVRFSYPRINYASERLDDVADQRFSVVEKRVEHAAVRVEAVEQQHRLHEIEQVRVPDVQKKVADVALASRFPPPPTQGTKIRGEKFAAR